jgi:hypothetical protein
MMHDLCEFIKSKVEHTHRYSTLVNYIVVLVDTYSFFSSGVVIFGSMMKLRSLAVYFYYYLLLVGWD